MTKPAMFCAEAVALRALSELDQLEEGWGFLVEQAEPTSWAFAMEMFGRHLLMTLTHLQVAMEITESEKRTEMGLPGRGESGARGLIESGHARPLLRQTALADVCTRNPQPSDGKGF